MTDLNLELIERAAKAPVDDDPAGDAVNDKPEPLDLDAIEARVNFDYNKFTHPVPAGYTVPKCTPMRRVETTPDPVETFFTLDYDHTVFASAVLKFYLDYDITKPKPPEEINSVIYNVSYLREVFPVAVYQGNQLWSAFSKKGERSTLYTSEIESFDTTPPKEETGDDDE